MTTMSQWQFSEIYLAKDAGSQEYGTARLTSSFKTKSKFASSTLNNGMTEPIIARDFVVAASSWQEPVKLNMALKLPSGTSPDISDFSLKYIAIWNYKSRIRDTKVNTKYEYNKNLKTC